jgi:hypothetical protein
VRIVVGGSELRVVVWRLRQCVIVGGTFGSVAGELGYTFINNIDGGRIIVAYSINRGVVGAWLHHQEEEGRRCLSKP